MRLRLIADSSAIAFPVLVDERRRGDVLVEPADQGQLGPLDGRDVADVLDDLRLEPGVRGEHQVGIGTPQLGVLEDADVVADGAAALEFDAIGEVGLHRVDPAGEGGVLEAPGHRAAGRALGRRRR